MPEPPPLDGLYTMCPSVRHRGLPLRFTITRWADYEEVGSVLEKGIQEKGVFVLLRATAPFV